MSKHLLSRRQWLKNLGILTLGSSLIGSRTLTRAVAHLPGSFQGASSERRFSTFSIAAYDPALQTWGIAVTSKAPAAGAIVSNIAMNEALSSSGHVVGGAVANQSYPDIQAATLGLQQLLTGASAQDTLAAIRKATTSEGDRQFGVVDWHGNATAFTGSKNPDWAGDIQGDGFTTQGNTLAGPEVLDAVAEYYTNSKEDFWFRLLNAIKAGEAKGVIAVKLA